MAKYGNNIFTWVVHDMELMAVKAKGDISIPYDSIIQIPNRAVIYVNSQIYRLCPRGDDNILRFKMTTVY